MIPRAGAGGELRARRLAVLQLRALPFGGSPPAPVLEIWLAGFDWMHEHVEGGIITYCMHPQVIGRGHRMAMLEQFVRHYLGAGPCSAGLGEVARSLEDGDA
jgi:hypothetical protein